MSAKITAAAEHLVVHGRIGECPEGWELSRALTYARDVPGEHSAARLARAVAGSADRLRQRTSMHWTRVADAALAKAMQS
jgi:hypothetical protein